MDIREAMEELEMIRDIFIDERCVSESESDEVTEEFEIAFSAMEKQISKKMILSPDCDKCDKEGTMDCTKECASYSTLQPVLICPNCKRIGGIEEHQYRFCPECGQAIDLSK